MYELLTQKRERSEQDVYRKWYINHQLKSKPEKGIKPVINRILDTIGL